tara:strand:+ start:739 stop:1041 length:303 start_codon:yes stop_codon:yes gene_type:complete
MKAKILIILFSILILASGCQTIKNKSDKVIKQENERYGKLVGKDVEELKIELGLPTDDFINESGNKILIYKTSKYGIPCERKFEVNENGIVESFSTSGCI